MKCRSHKINPQRISKSDINNRSKKSIQNDGSVKDKL